MRRCRPFKLIDAMILVANAALGMASMRPGLYQFQTFWAGAKSPPTWQAYAMMAHAIVTTGLLILSVAYVWIRLIPPRLPTSDLVRQPGILFWIAMIGLSFPLLALSAFAPLTAATNRVFALALALSWGAACVRYQARAEPGWIERLGRCFGVGLVISIAAS